MRRALKRWTGVLMVSTALHLTAALADVQSPPMSGGGGGQGVAVSIEIGGGGSGQPAQPVAAGSAAVAAPPDTDPVVAVPATAVAPNVAARTDAVAKDTPADVVIAAADERPTGPQSSVLAEPIQQAEPMQAAQSAPQNVGTAEAVPAAVSAPAVHPRPPCRRPT